MISDSVIRRPAFIKARKRQPLHALQRCATRVIGKTVCGLQGKRHHITAVTRRLVCHDSYFRVAGPDEQPTCQRCQFVLKGKKA